MNFNPFKLISFSQYFWFQNIFGRKSWMPSWIKLFDVRQNIRKSIGTYGAFVSSPGSEPKSKKKKIRCITKRK